MADLNKPQENDSLQQVTVNLPAELVDYLHSQSSARGVSAADVLQKAIVNDRFLRAQQQAGSNVLVEKGSGLTRVEL